MIPCGGSGEWFTIEDRILLDHHNKLCDCPSSFAWLVDSQSCDDVGDDDENNAYNSASPSRGDVLLDYIEYYCDEEEQWVIAMLWVNHMIAASLVDLRRWLLVAVPFHLYCKRRLQNQSILMFVYNHMHLTFTIWWAADAQRGSGTFSSWSMRIKWL